MTAPTATKTTCWTSRAVRRRVEAGSWVSCTHCQDTISFADRERSTKAICNVYEDGVWQRVEHFHEDCYQSLGEPHGHLAE